MSRKSDASVEQRVEAVLSLLRKEEATHLTSSYCASEFTRAVAKARLEAKRIPGPLSTILFLVTDNGPSFMAKRCHRFVRNEFRHVRIQYRTPTQLGLLERFHRTLKEEAIYWRDYGSPAHALECIEEFRLRYNEHRPHWALVPEGGGDPHTPGKSMPTATARKSPGGSPGLERTRESWTSG